MTQPDKNFPPSAVNKDSLGAFAAKTREDWEREQREAAAAQWAESVRQMQKLLGNVPLIGDLIEIFSGIEDGDLNDFGTAFNRWKNFWGGGLKGLLDAVMDFFEPIKEFVDGFGEVGKAVDDAVQGGVKFISDGLAFVGGGIAATLGAIGQGISEGLKATQGVFDELGKAVFGTAVQIGAGVQGAVDGFGLALQNLWNQLTGTTTKADTAIGNNTLTNIKIYEGYFGVGNASGEVAQVQETIAAIKTKITGGYTLQTLTFNSDMVSQTIIIRPTSGGTFTLSYGGKTTGSIAWNASASVIQAALRGLSTIGGTNVIVTAAPSGFGEPNQYAWFVDFNTAAIPSPTAITATSSLSGGAVVDCYGIWRPPWATSADAPREFYAIAFGAGQAGGAGNDVVYNLYSYVSGGYGGAPGGYAAVEFDASQISTPCHYIVAPGPAGSTSSTTGTIGGESVFVGPGGIPLLTQAGQFFVSNILGYYTSNQSAPGRGGDGGLGYGLFNGVYYAGSNGARGGQTLLASGGAGGVGGATLTLGPRTNFNYSGETVNATANVGTTPTKGSIGGKADLTGKSRAGGGGGGGGGGSYCSYLGTRRSAGLGGNGGFPGGGGGGGGGAFFWDYNQTNAAPLGCGNGGYGGNGVIVLIWK